MRENNWNIIDDTGVIHSGSEEEMKLAFEFMSTGLSELKARYKGNYTMRQIRNMCNEYGLQWDGDLKLIEIHAITR